MELLTNLLASEPFLALVATIVGAAITYAQSTAAYERLRERRWFQAVQAVEAGVLQTWNSYTKAIKEARDDGKLTPAEIQRARKMARETAVRFAETQGVDVVKELGDQYVDLYVERALAELKAEGVAD